MVADGLVDSDEFETAIDDVLWVLLHVVGGISCIPAKRAHNAETDTVMELESKRYVRLLHFQLLGLTISMQLPYVRLNVKILFTYPSTGVRVLTGTSLII